MNFDIPWFVRISTVIQDANLVQFLLCVLDSTADTPTCPDVSEDSKQPPPQPTQEETEIPAAAYDMSMYDACQYSGQLMYNGMSGQDGESMVYDMTYIPGQEYSTVDEQNAAMAYEQAAYGTASQDSFSFNKPDEAPLVFTGDTTVLWSVG